MSNSINNFNLTRDLKQHQKLLNTQLKEETKKILEEFGIDPSTVTTEMEAQQKIKEAQSAQVNSDVVPTQTFKGNPMQKILADARDLAQRLDINSDGNNISDLLKNIEDRIAGFGLNGSEDLEQQQILEALKEEFNGITSVFNQAQQGQAKISGDLKLLASYNKLNSDVNIGAVTKEQINVLQRPEKSNNEHQQNAEDNERNAARGVNDRFDIDVQNENDEDGKAIEKEEETSFLGQLKEKLSGGIFKKEDAFKLIEGEEVTDRQLFDSAKKLAIKIGMPVDKSAGINELLFNINNRIAKLESDSSQNETLIQGGNIFDIRREFNVIYNTYVERQL